MKVCFETFGCRLNKAEALQMEAEYLARGWELAENHSDADLIVVRGCSVTTRAQSECERLIARLRHRYPDTPLRICGCLEERSRSKVEVDSGRSINPTIQQSDNQTLKSSINPTIQKSNNPTILQPLPTRTARAYLKVQDGCSGKCSFCIVPRFRGPSRSVPFTELLDTARRFIDAGYREIVVTGCNLSLYASAGRRLPDLVSSLADLSPDCRLRLGSLEPGGCAPETVSAMSERTNVCRFLHLPVQSGSGRILAAMGRPYRIRDVDALVAAAVTRLPGLGLGCDLMTGFPGESEKDFRASEELLERLPFNNAHVFPYSERPGTPAAEFGGSVPKNVRSQRARCLTRRAKLSRKDFADSFLGRTVDVVIEDGTKAVGWTGEYLKCQAEGTAPRKSRVRVRVTGVRADCLFGQIA